MSNPYQVIKQFVFVTGFCIVSCTTALAQQALFVYLHTENWQPFYVQMDDKVYSSSNIGHLVISGLTGKTCNFEVGFPQHTIQPQRFSIPLHDRDHGYELVKNGSRGWALRNWQTDEIIKPLKEAGSSSLLYGERKQNDAFATLMAAVVNDSAVLYTSIVKNENPAVPPVTAKTEERPAAQQPEIKKEEKAVQAPDSAVSVVNIDTAAVTDSASLVKMETISVVDSSQSIKSADTLVTKYDPKERPLSDKPDKPAGVAKIQQQSKNGETKMVFVDSSESPAKVVTVYIEEEKSGAERSPAAEVAKSDTKQMTTLPSVKQELQVEVVTNNEQKDTDSAKAAPSKEKIAEQIKKETWKPAAGEKAPATDTMTIILGSDQQKKASGTGEVAQPLYRPKQEPKTEPEKPATLDSAGVQMAATAKPAVEDTARAAVTQPKAEEKIEMKQDAVKPATEEKTTAEPEKPAVAEVKKEKEPVPDPEKKVVTEPAETKKDTVAAAKAEMPAAAKPDGTENAKAVLPEKKEETSGKLVMINSDCVKLATDNDIDKMRVKMMAENDLQKKLTIANKYFKTMCLYARQIKGLSELFPTDEAKYKFLEQAYPFAADTANFKQLYELLTAEEYVTKFKTLVRLQ